MREAMTIASQRAGAELRAVAAAPVPAESAPPVESD